jgi:hypothetical protein
VPRLLDHVRWLSLTLKRTFVVQRSRGFEHFATTFQPVSVCLLFVKMQKVSPAQAPSVLMTAGSSPSRKLRAEQVPASGAQTPTKLVTLSPALVSVGCDASGCISPGEAEIRDFAESSATSAADS